MKEPKKWKMALITWLCIYPLLNIIFIALMPHIMHWHPLLRTLLTTLILVPLMGICVDYFRKSVGNWLYK